ncbi:hypothetical protein [Moritella sp. 28]|uniref:hypothetical protein n=1 Tax=Moritella sp. 28 TaxID=2746232 RepID=UPI001BAC15DD|nr:hypothetical protein [Moritella sp. 28]QUM83760.1 hypothetical protein HWV02_04085 [Moritella sp. 28]
MNTSQQQQINFLYELSKQNVTQVKTLTSCVTLHQAIKYLHFLDATINLLCRTLD